MKVRSRKIKKRNQNRVIPLVVFLFGFAGLIALLLLLVVRDVPMDSDYAFDEASALEDLVEKETAPESVHSYEALPEFVTNAPVEQALTREYSQAEITEILNQHVEAMGGWFNWNGVESIRTVGIIKREDQQFPIVIIKKRPNLIRATVRISMGDDDSEMRVVRAYDGERAWTAAYPVGNRDFKKEYLSQAEAQDLLPDAGVLPPLIKFWQEDAALSILGQSIIDGEAHYMVEAKPKGFPNKYVFYLSLETFHVSQYDKIDASTGRTRTLLKDYTYEQGIYIPKRSITHSEKMGSTMVTTLSNKIGVGIYKEYFQAGNRAINAKL